MSEDVAAPVEWRGMGTAPQGPYIRLLNRDMDWVIGRFDRVLKCWVCFALNDEGGMDKRRFEPIGWMEGEG